MNVLAAVTNFVGGGLFKEIKEGLLAYFPPDSTPEQKLQYELQITELLDKKEIEANKILTSAAAQLDKRIAQQEGTAKDLLGLPIFGRMMLFLRGTQRPVWGFGVLYMDYLWFATPLLLTEQQELALTVINLLVLGFLFGERTVKNLEPLILKIFDRILK